MATYQQIRDDVFNHSGFRVKNAWIAHVKELNGLILKPSPSRSKDSERKNPCPEDLRSSIEASMRRLGMLDR
jgi:23S rRNA (uracil1939-C5)-methyltransferase